MSAVIQVKNKLGNFVEARALLDSCSTAHFVTERLVKSLGLTVQGKKRAISAIDGACATSCGSVEILMRSRLNSHERLLTFLVVKIIAETVPDERFPREQVNIPSNIPLADPDFHIPRQVDLLIGAGTTLSLFSIGQINLSKNNDDLYLQKTLLGWVIAGGFNSDLRESFCCNLLTLKEQVARFWEMEEIGEKACKTKDEVECEEHYVTNVRRGRDGRYTVRLPFKTSNLELGNSKSRAFQRFKALERKFQSQPSFRLEYEAVMQEYIDSGHMTLARGECVGGFYLPHHAVVKLSSSTTKTRVVFDASAKTEKGKSLNSELMVGPTIQPKLFEILLRFRSYPFVITADIERMYRQVWVDSKDRKFQRILWYDKGLIRTFELNTVTFGVASAPFLAIRTLHQLADDEKSNFPLACQVLRTNFYVDDMLAGANSVEEVIQVRNEVIQLLHRGGFNIRKWASNSARVLDELGKDIVDISQLDGLGVQKTLGITWNSKSDRFVYSAKKIDIPTKVTKRHILSEVAKIFDPLGLLGPIVLYAKLIMQECWKSMVTWDESVPQSLHTRWISFASQLSTLQQVSIPRFMSLSNVARVQIHGFCDASQVGYGAALYVRSVSQEGQVSVKLMCSKSRVAPIKQITLPRLELCGAVMLVRLFKECQDSFIFSVDRLVFWSDSEIVLQWLKHSPRDLQVFVGNRVAEIQGLSESVEWRHVAGRNNVADRLSRGQIISEFLSGQDWLSGPRWLQYEEEDCPKSVNNIIVDLPGLKSESCFLVMPEKGEFYLRFSSYSKLLRVTALCLRLKFPSVGFVSVFKKERAERRLMFMVQGEHYHQEIASLKKGQLVRNLKLRKLSPFLDEHGLMRVGGRLGRSQLSEGQKHPILLPSNHHITRLIIEETHKVTLHSGVQGTLYSIRQRFWLVDGKHHIRRVIRSCTKCIRYRPEVLQAKMSDLPRARVEQSAVFSNVGVDYFGPISIKEKKFRNRVVLKAYGCMFICMATKAVHLEIVSDLSTESFLAALRRFIGRRGSPAHIYSDNGTNFVGANHDLQELFALFESSRFKDSLNSFNFQHNIVWHFNPPVSPHFGGIWEAVVKSANHHLKRVVGGQLLTFEQLTTLAVEIEAFLNSRPISAMSSDPNDPEVLTPSHFLIGRPMISLPDQNILHIPDNRLSIWRFITKARQDFWKRWHLEYLSELQKRQKWLENKGQITPGSVVVVIEKDQPCYKWPLAIIKEVCPGSDGATRIVKLKTQQGEYTRNITSLCPLPHTSL